MSSTQFNNGITQLEIDRTLAVYRLTIDEDQSVPSDKKETLYNKVKEIVQDKVSKDKEWINEYGKFRAILKPGDKEYNQSFHPEPHYTDWRFANELALAAYLVLDKVKEST